VFGTSRRASGTRADGGVEMIAMDVDSDASVESAVATVLERPGRIDAVVNNVPGRVFERIVLRIYGIG
jgi:NAD(P)-dependent dehydrogenase (short-subunit alcohol dehydrogenase family)